MATPIINTNLGKVVTATGNIADDLSTLRPLLRNMLFNAYATDKVENTPIASFPDGADNVPMKSATFAITPVQNLHGYDNPWPAGGGKNLFDKDNINALNAYISDETIVGGGARTIYIPCKPNTTYTVSKTLGARLLAKYTNVLPAIGVGTLGGADPTGTALKYTVTTGADAQYIVAYVYNSSIDAGLTFEQIANTIQIEEGSTATTWTPYSNICPITGFTGAEITDRGVNLWDGTGEDGKAMGGAGTTYDAPTAFATDYVMVKPSTTVYINPTNWQNWVDWYDASKTFISQETASSGLITSPYNAVYGRFTGRLAEKAGASINYPSTDTAYHASVGATHDITWQDEAGTVYGGTIAYLGGDMWRLTATHYLYVYDGTEYFAKSGTALNGFYNNLVVDARPHSWPQMKSSPYNDGVKCSMFAITNAANYYKNNYGCMYLDSGHNFSCEPSVFGTTAESFKAKLAELYAAGTPVTVCCAIAEPQVHDLTGEELATVLGTNNVFSNTGDVTELVYRADTALYIEKKLAE